MARNNTHHRRKVWGGEKLQKDAASEGEGGERGEGGGGREREGEGGWTGREGGRGREGDGSWEGERKEVTHPILHIIS